MVVEIYEALKAAGAPEEKAKSAAQAIFAKEEVATKQDIGLIRKDLAEMETRITRTILTAMLGMTAIFAAIVKLF